MKRQFILTALIIGLFGLVNTFAQEPVQQPETIESLQKRISEVVSKPQYAAGAFGVKVVSLDTGKVIYENEANKLFSPASNSKLYTMALALDQLGPDYRIKTSLYAKEKPTSRGVVKGDLVVFGRGDPTINQKLRGTNVYKMLQPFVAALTNAGVKRITGDLIGDESYFRTTPYGSGWDSDDLQYYYGAEISALTILDNLLTLNVKPGKEVGSPCQFSLNPPTSYVQFINRTRTTAKGGKRNINLYRPMGQNVVYVSGEMGMDDNGSNEDVTLHNPAGLFVTLLKDALAKNGIKVSGKVRSMNWRDREVEPFKTNEWVELGYVESLPMRDIIAEVQKPSQNLYTDLMLLHVAARLQPEGTITEASTEDLGIKELRNFLTRIGVKRGDTIFEEGSGLSRNNLTTPNATIILLQHMAKHKCSDVYINALPIAGVDGTLRRRMKGTAAAGNVKAKTGTLRWANSLSGYVTTATGERLVFSMMLNRYHNSDSSQAKTADLDAIAVMLAGFTGRTNP